MTGSSLLVTIRSRILTPSAEGSATLHAPVRRPSEITYLRIHRLWCFLRLFIENEASRSVRVEGRPQRAPFSCEPVKHW